ncbi:hypothetical protein [Halodesulfovibrio spirochaetisodalis]|uniref:Uncharacterized protein n=1 Tax=Halodesulfovibrio spirochaetisodalis TaxID=1560234 RepID=A0A1B7XAI9_9BACT|nr:hypothetical protein [Halodesulfovibrio spirochaetisodalis]OBQ46346.1 hypothetical protein SP90_13120 [Halodesulfovibrio spirochaetisodalis]
MERALRKLAAQLNGYDEASLMDLWEKYAQKTEDFAPTREWEEAALIFSLIQAVRWKNQLFNHHWAESEQGNMHSLPPQAAFDLVEKDSKEQLASNAGRDGSDAAPKLAKVLPFRPRKGD